MKYALPLLLLSGALQLLACGGSAQQRTPAPPPPSTAIPPAPERAVRTPVPAAADTVAPGTDATAAGKPEPRPGSGVPAQTGPASGPKKDIAKMDDAEMTETSKSTPPLATANPRSFQNGFTDIHKLDSSLILDIRYATTNNFTKAKIYDCPRCLLRTEAAEALLKAHRALRRQGLGLKLFDCYRPRPYQQRLWDKAPDPDYVTPPAQGSMHSRGAAVDLTIVDAGGNELDMGTPYDFFGREAHFDYGRLPAKVLANRRLLRKTMLDAGFEGIRTEWWHFSYRKKAFPLSDFVWDCNGR